jgi:hypothetical protein
MRKLVEILYFCDPISTDRLEEQLNSFLKKNPTEYWEPGSFIKAPWIDESDNSQHVEYIQTLYRYEVTQ